MSQQKEEGISIELTEENAQGKYSNLAVITHSPAEFIVDFIEECAAVQEEGDKEEGQDG
jgi:hypothetical protein